MSVDLVHGRVVVHPDPPAEASRLAADTGAELVTTAADAEAAVRSRLRAGRDPLTVLAEIEQLDQVVDGHDPDQDHRLAVQVERLRLAVRHRSPTPADVAHLATLSEQLEVMGRIRHRTEAEAATRLADSLGVSTRLAIHPDSLRSAGQALLAAEATRERVVKASLETGSPVDSEVGGSQDQPPEMAPPEGRRARPWVPAAVILVIGVGAGAALLFSPVPALAAAPVVLAVVLALVVEMWSRRRAREAADRRAAAANLARASATADRGTATSPLQPPEMAVAQAEKELTAARRAWESLAGPAADPHDLDAVVRDHDPQLALAPELIEATPAARTALAMERRTRARWRVGWAELGRPCPDPGQASRALATLEREATDSERVVDLTVPDRLAEAEAAARRIEARQRRQELLDHRTVDQLRAEAATHRSTRRPLVLLEPFKGLGPHRRTLLRRQLDQLPATAEVTVLVADPESVPSPPD